MARSLPLWPYLLFGVVEPGLLIWAYYVLLQGPKTFYVDQMPGLSAKSSPFPPQAEIIVYVLGNIYLLLAGLAVVCCWTSHGTVARNYLIVVALGDLGHIYAVYRVFGWINFINFGQWNDMTWGNVGVSAFLHVNRLATVLGVFGRIR